jgi:hypothetical protein
MERREHWDIAHGRILVKIESMKMYKIDRVIRQRAIDGFFVFIRRSAWPGGFNKIARHLRSPGRHHNGSMSLFDQSAFQNRQDLFSATRHSRAWRHGRKRDAQHMHGISRSWNARRASASHSTESTPQSNRS